jgi:hypothetical protein
MFFSFVTTTGCLNVIVLATAIAHLVVLTNEYKEQGKGGGDAFVQSMQEEPISVALAIYSAAIVWFTVGLCLYHSYLILTNQTTYEAIKGVYSMGNNPFSRGFLGNCQDILCSRVRPRYFNAAENRLIWYTTPGDEAARELKINPSRSAARGDKRYEASGGYGPRDGAQAKVAAKTSVSNDPFLTQQAGAKTQGETKLPTDKGSPVV